MSSQHPPILDGYQAPMNLEEGMPSNGAKPKGGSQISPQIAADPAIAHDLIYTKAAQIHDDSPVSTIFRHSFR